MTPRNLKHTELQVDLDLQILFTSVIVLYSNLEPKPCNIRWEEATPSYLLPCQDHSRATRNGKVVPIVSLFLDIYGHDFKTEWVHTCVFIVEKLHITATLYYKNELLAHSFLQ